MTDRGEKPPTNTRVISATTTRNLIVGFVIILFVVGLGLIGWLYGVGGFAGGFICILSGVGLIGVVIFVMNGIEILSKWLDET